MPMPSLSVGQPRRSNSCARLATASCMSYAAATAWAAWSGSASGAPQKAIIASPMYLSMVPWWRCTTSVSGVSRAFSSAVSSRGSMRSAWLVKSWTSQNSTLSSRASPSRSSACGSRPRRAARSGGTYCPNSEMTACFFCTSRK